MQTRASAWPPDVSGQTLPVVLVRVHGESRTSTRMQRKQSSRGSCVDGGFGLGHGSQLLFQSIGWSMDACLCPCRRHSQWLSLLPLSASPYIQGNLSDNVNVAAETRFAPAHPDLRRAPAAPSFWPRLHPYFHLLPSEFQDSQDKLKVIQPLSSCTVQQTGGMSSSTLPMTPSQVKGSAVKEGGKSRISKDKSHKRKEHKHEHKSKHDKKHGETSSPSKSSRRRAKKHQQSSADSPTGLLNNHIQLKDESNNPINLGTSKLPESLIDILQRAQKALGVDPISGGVRVVHERGQGRVVPIFDRKLIANICYSTQLTECGIF